MNDNQKERLLKIAETNPELAKDVVDILKQEFQQSNEPIAVKMVKSEEDKIEITVEQKRYATKYIATIVIGVLFSFILGIITIVGSIYDDRFIIMIFAVFGLIVIVIFSSWYFGYKAGMPTIKSFLSRHFKWS
ncbi:MULTISPECIES: hypothetical protein [Cysteiniphilum]|uniref:Uncharacterized protein n=1 Tax=Cysteiniphilum litorale TaxID=2056700 RepID=A0A8J2Z730_9GAMM|nr:MULTISPECIES: hypothetical protein [Cysteiniphilum]GGG08329.1 hypothetical protein GCM10010995_27340 [Cysteiniphilum litorale]